MEFDRRYLLKTALGSAASLALGAPAFAQVAAQPFAQWVETFRARALAKGVSDATYTRVLAKFGEQGIIDLIGVNGYYTFLAMVLNATRTALPKGAVPPLAAFPH